MTTTQAFSGAVTAENDVLPVWDFKNFYPAVNSPEFEADFKKLSAIVESFVADYKGKMASLDSQGLYLCMQRRLDIGDIAGKLSTFINMKWSLDSAQYTADKQAFQKRISQLMAPMAFFSFELKEADPDALIATVKELPELEHYLPFFESIVRNAKYKLPLEISEYVSELRPSSGWMRMFDDILSKEKVLFEGAEIGLGKLGDIGAFDPDPARRRAALAARQSAYQNTLRFHVLMYNEMIRLEQVDDKKMGIANPWDSRHIANNIEPAVVDALESSVKAAYPRLSHRFYKLKAALMGQDHLHIADRNVNVFADSEGAYIPFARGQEIVQKAYDDFDPRAGDTVRRFFTEGWIDAKPGDYKDDGAYATRGALGLVNSFVLMNWRGTPSDVRTLAHELGHGIHHMLSGHKGERVLSTPLTFAETASVFGEMLVFRDLLKAVQSDEERRVLLFDKVNSMLNTVVRQISFYDFERRVHGQAKETGRAVSEEDMKRHWLESQRESYGDSIPLDESYGSVFASIPHFVHAPFYVYAYAFGDALVNALYGVYEEGSVPDFKDKYFQMLEMGGTVTPAWLKENFGLDIADPGFWNKGLAVIETMIDELEVLCQPLLKPAPAPAADLPPGLAL
ncbi:MAG TPA: M3 family metallopeptidase [Alphaproteobacteria bacterium]|nr:M3 family metallopeptidase [Alphaproteobacteria bacterium]